MLPGFNPVLNDEDSTGYLVSFGARPTSLALNYQLEARIEPEEYTLQGVGNFTPFGRLSTDLKMLETNIYITGLIQDWELIAVGSAALLGDELVRVDMFDPLTGALTLGRGCVDTQPRLHAEGTMIWFYQNYNGFSGSAWWSGLIIDARMRTRTSSALLSADDAPIDSITMNNRARRPYLPGRIQFNGIDYPASVEKSDSYLLSWAHRDRRMQAEQLIDCTFGNIGPETGVEYHVSVQDEDGAISWETTTTENSVDIPYSTVWDPLGLFTPHTVTLTATRDGLDSLQSYRVQLPPGYISILEEIGSAL
jgi:hypothetical protein